ncbi:MAG: DUF1905 domain-containing protein [Chitinophagaceae bacterium]|nr:MAG: DUF1905 domain-containing protein [Chitinophagaceae bacterium]
MKIAFKTTLEKFGQQGEKTGWTYFEIPANLATKLKSGTKVSFRVKGSIDDHPISQVSILPMGEGNFIMPFNANMRKATRKKVGDTIHLQLEADDTEVKLSTDFLSCLADDPAAFEHFNSLPKSHQQYYSKWIETAKTEPTKTKRIAVVVNGLARKMDFGAMLREQRENKLTR